MHDKILEGILGKLDLLIGNHEQRTEQILGRIELLVDRARVYGDQVRFDLRMAMHVRRQIVDLFDVWLTEADDGRRRVALELLKNRAEKEIGPWFWRRDKDIDVEDSLRSRARQLRDMGTYSMQWQWDLLVELMTDWTGEADTGLLERIIQEAHSAKSAG